MIFVKNYFSQPQKVKKRILALISIVNIKTKIRKKNFFNFGCIYDKYFIIALPLLKDSISERSWKRVSRRDDAFRHWRQRRFCRWRRPGVGITGQRTLIYASATDRLTYQYTPLHENASEILWCFQKRSYYYLLENNYYLLKDIFQGEKKNPPKLC